MTKFKHYLFFLYIIIGFLTVDSLARAESTSINNSWLNISNSAKCSADLKNPTQSIFISANFRNLGIMLNNLSKKTDLDQTEFIGQGLHYNKYKLTQLSQIIIQSMNTGRLPLVKSKSEAEAQWHRLRTQNLEDLNTPYLEKINCIQVNEINTYYSHLFLRGINQMTLTEIGKQFSTKKPQTLCTYESIPKNLELYPVYNIDAKIVDEKIWQTIGFDFWASFKIYLSHAWRNHNLPEFKKSAFEKISLMIPIEDQILMLSNGCKGFEKPECNSDFLSSSELRTLFSNNRSKLSLTSSSLEMKDQLTDNQQKVEESIQVKLAEKSADNQWIKDFQKSFLSFSSTHLNYLYSANTLFSSVMAQKGTENLKSDLISEIKNKEFSEEAYYLCLENRVLTQNEPFSLYKTDLENLDKNSARLDQFLKYGINSKQMIQTYLQLAENVTKVCNDYDASLSKESSTQNWVNYKPWYKNFLSRYKIRDFKTEEQTITKQINQKSLIYVNGLCSSSIDCHRELIKSIVEVNKLLLHSKSFVRSEISSSQIFNENANQVACGIYDPWEAGKLNKKKLMTDIGSSLLFGWTALPIYLDVNYNNRTLTSFNKLVDDGHIKFDLGFDQKQVKKSLAVNFGALLGAPCSVQFSQTNSQISDIENNYVFKGITGASCVGQKSENTISQDGTVEEFKKSSDKDYKMCGQCTINFEKVSAVSAIGVFNPLGFVIRMASSIVRYNEVKNNQIINPTEFSLNTDDIVQTYLENNRSIPERCVDMLSRGLSCQKNICASLAVREYELLTNEKVESIDLVYANAQLPGQTKHYTSALFKNKRNQKTYKIPMACEENGDMFNLNLNSNMIQQIKAEK